MNVLKQILKVAVAWVHAISIWLVSLICDEDVASQRINRLVLLCSFAGRSLRRVAVDEYGVHRNVEAVIYHPWQHLLEQGVAFLQTGVCVDFDQDGVEVLVQNKVIPKQLKSVLLVQDLSFDRLDGVYYYFVLVLFELLFEFFLRLAFSLGLLGDEVEERIC